LLPNPGLKPVYGDVEWVYVYRDFTRDERDRRAERIQLRFGVSSWPQLFLVDPNTLEIANHTGRTVESFLAALKRTSVERPRGKAPLERLVAAEKRADDLERTGDVRAAVKALDDDDIVVRYQALAVVAAKKPKSVVAKAKDLLAVPHDPFRYEVCRVLEEAKDPAAAPALEALVKDPGESLNPNVVRINAVRALGACGAASSVDAIRPYAASGEYFNGLTGVAVDALAAIGKRVKRARKAVEEALKASYPPPAPANDDRATKACVALARRIHAALDESKPFPSVYDDAARRKLMK